MDDLIGISFTGAGDGKGYYFQIVNEEKVKLSAAYLRIITSIINDGRLSKSYQVDIDEKYGITVEQEPEPTEVPVEETEQPEEPVVQNNGGSDKKSANKPSRTNTKPKEEKSAQVQTPARPQAPVEQPVQQPVANQPQQSSGSSNENNLPEFYMDFE